MGREGSQQIVFVVVVRLHSLTACMEYLASVELQELCSALEICHLG